MARSRRGRGGRGYSYERREEPELHPIRVDLHIHTPYSADYQDLDATYLQILQAADSRGLGMIALTDHNTAGGVAAMRREIEDLTLLEDLDRLSPEEAQILTEYRRLLDQILVLPGIEFTAAYGFHILGIFPPDTSVRRLEHLLLTLGLTEAQMDAGSALVENTADVLTAYEIIDEFGGLAIPAHANVARGVAMQAVRYGEQTRIAYTQSPLIAALEVTDLDDTSRRGSAASFSGTHTDYPRQMHLIQGSDAHRVTREGALRDTDLGVGDRAMELMLPERSFVALRQLFASDTFTHERPYFPMPERASDPILAARDIGPTITQAFHEQARSRRSRFRPVLKDVVAFANTNGGTIYIGLSPNPNTPVAGVPLVDEAARGLRDAATRSIVPRLDVTIEVEPVQGKPIIVVRVPKGPNTPYATEAGQVFVRQDGETVIALRDEIVQLVRESIRDSSSASVPAPQGERHWNTPRPIVDFDEEETDGDAEPTRRASAPAPASAPPAPPTRATLPVTPPTVSAPPARPSLAPPVPPSLPPVSSPTRAAQVLAPEILAKRPAPAPAALIPQTPVAPVSSVPFLTPATEELLPPIDTLVDTVPGVLLPPPAGTSASVTREAVGEPDAEMPAPPARPPRRRPSRARSAGSDVGALAETATAEPSAVPASTMRNEAIGTQANTLPVYSLEPAQNATLPVLPVDDVLPVADSGIVAITEATEGDTASAPTTTAAPRRRRRAPSKGKAAEATPDAIPDVNTTTDTAPPTDMGDAISETDTAMPSPHRDETTEAVPPPTTDFAGDQTVPPTTGVEILSVEEAPGGRKYTMRDLQTGRISNDVTRKSARGQSRQAILAREDRLPNEEKIVWHGARGYGRTVVRDGAPQHDLALREPDGQIRIFYAVTNDGLDPDWQTTIPGV